MLNLVIFIAQANWGESCLGLKRQKPHWAVLFVNICILNTPGFVFPSLGIWQAVIAHEKAVSKLYFEEISKYWFWMILLPLHLPNLVQQEAWTLSGSSGIQDVWANTTGNQITLTLATSGAHLRWQFQLQKRYANRNNEMFHFIKFLARGRDCIRREKGWGVFTLISVTLISSNFCRGEKSNLLQ